MTLFTPRVWPVTIVGSASKPPMASPNAYAGVTGVTVHRTRWEWQSGRLIAWPACYARQKLIRPGRWTYDSVTCTRCPKRGFGQAPQKSHALIKRRMRLWTQIVAAVGELSGDIFPLGWATDPVRGARFDRLAAISEDFFISFLEQCVDAESHDVLTVLIAEHRQTMLDIVLEDLADGKTAA